MSSATVRISTSARDDLRGLSDRTGKAMQTVVEVAIELYRCQLFLREINEAYASLGEEAWSKIAEERAEWDTTLSDGLGDD